jgi:hypothetical protein
MGCSENVSLALLDLDLEEVNALHHGCYHEVKNIDSVDYCIHRFRLDLDSPLLARILKLLESGLTATDVSVVLRPNFNLASAPGTTHPLGHHYWAGAESLLPT